MTCLNKIAEMGVNGCRSLIEYEEAMLTTIRNVMISGSKYCSPQGGGVFVP